MVSRDFLAFVVAGQAFGIPVLDVHDVIRAQPTNRVPMSGREITGMLNLRGRIVTVLDLRARLDVEPRPDDSASMYIVVHLNGEPYGLVVDSVGDVIHLDGDHREPTPPNFTPLWKSVVLGVHRMPQGLLLILDVAQVIDGARVSPERAA